MKQEEVHMPIIKKPKTFTPPEAYQIAAKFRRQASHVRGLARQLREVQSTLDSTWEGNSKNRFSSRYNPEISKMDSFAEWLEERAGHIEGITVTIWEEVYVPDDNYA
jgi:WXG100 family type VII secretion target